MCPFHVTSALLSPLPAGYTLTFCAQDADLTVGLPAHYLCLSRERKEVLLCVSGTEASSAIATLRRGQAEGPLLRYPCLLGRSSAALLSQPARSSSLTLS